MANPLADLRELYTSRGDLTHRDSSQRTLLLRAAQRGQVDLVKYFLSLGMNTEAVNNCHQTSLFIACYNGNFAIVSTLLGKLKPSSLVHSFSLIPICCRTWRRPKCAGPVQAQLLRVKL